jgi:membrane-associated phospholipid phosphatase
VFPSVHVLGVIAAVSAVWHTPGLRKWGWRAGSLALGIVIIAATLFVKQHAFIDVLAGLFVGALGDIIVYVVIGKKRDRLMAEGKRLRYGSCQNADS